MWKGMEMIKLDSSIFKTEVGVRLVKALQGNETINGYTLIGVYNDWFITDEEETIGNIYENYDLPYYHYKEITFNLDDNLKVDWAFFRLFPMLGNPSDCKFNLTELAKIEGIEINEEGE
jgi:hypothetical protein